MQEMIKRCPMRYLHKLDPHSDFWPIHCSSEPSLEEWQRDIRRSANVYSNSTNWTADNCDEPNFFSDLSEAGRYLTSKLGSQGLCVLTAAIQANILLKHPDYIKRRDALSAQGLFTVIISENTQDQILDVWVITQFSRKDFAESLETTQTLFKPPLLTWIHHRIELQWLNCDTLSGLTDDDWARSGFTPRNLFEIANEEKDSFIEHCKTKAPNTHFWYHNKDNKVRNIDCKFRTRDEVWQVLLPKVTKSTAHHHLDPTRCAEQDPCAYNVLSKVLETHSPREQSRIDFIAEFFQHLKENLIENHSFRKHPCMQDSFVEGSLNMRRLQLFSDLHRVTSNPEKFLQQPKAVPQPIRNMTARNKILIFVVTLMAAIKLISLKIIMMLCSLVLAAAIARFRSCKIAASPDGALGKRSLNDAARPGNIEPRSSLPSDTANPSGTQSLTPD
jgi:hypothetical protein